MIAVVLAAGQGTRMKSQLPKVLHELRGRPLLDYPIRSAMAAGARAVVVVVGYRHALVEQRLQERFAREVQTGAIRTALQSRQLGTGHAAACGLGAVEEDEGPVMILSGDVPLLRASTLGELQNAQQRSTAGLALVTFRPRDPEGYGRIIRDSQGQIVGIREQSDCSREELEIDECNAGVYCVDGSELRTQLSKLNPDNAQGELYLTDLVHALAVKGTVEAIEVSALEVAGVNTPQQLAALEQAVALASASNRG